MEILDDILSTLPSDAPVLDVRLGCFQTAVLSRNCGLASSPHHVGPHSGGGVVGEAGHLTEKGALELAALARSDNPFEAAIGMAAINSLVEIDEQRCRDLNAGDLIAEKGRGKRIAVIGHFPFVPKLRQIAKELWVIEKQPREGDLAEEETQQLVPEADVVAITGTAFTNHTIQNILDLCHPDAYVVVLGGTTPLSSVLFEYGVDAISGAVVLDPETVLRCVSQGATFRQLKGIRLVTMM